jgi:hypothetical protein
MLMSSKNWTSLFGLILLIAFGQGCTHHSDAADHPGPAATAQPTEHPSGAPSRGASSDSGLSPNALAQAVRKYVDSQASKDHGYFDVHDPVAQKKLHLSLVRIMNNHLAGLGDGVYFACADFRSRDDRLYDIDVFMKQTPSGLQGTHVSVHKVNGKARYYWVEEGGRWTKRPRVSWWDRLFGRARECK